MPNVSIVLALAGLVVIANIQHHNIPKNLKATGVVASFLLALFLGVVTLKTVVNAFGLKDKTQTFGLVKGLLNQVSSIQPNPVNIILIDGSSGTSRGLDGHLFEQILSQGGYPSVVLQISLPGANHFERYSLHKSFWRSLTISQRTALAESNFIFMRELNPGYDSSPFQGLEGNENADRTIAYMTPKNAYYGLKALALIDINSSVDERKLTRTILVDIITNSLINYFQVGRINRITFEKYFSIQPGYDPLLHQRIPYPGNDHFLKFLDELQHTLPIQEMGSVTWLTSIRDQRLKNLYGDIFDHTCYFLTPNLYADYHQEAYSLAAKEPESIFIPTESLYQKLNAPSFWYDNGHLLKPGAEIYTRWLAEQLIKTGMLKKGAAPQS